MRFLPLFLIMLLSLAPALHAEVDEGSRQAITRALFPLARRAPDRIEETPVAGVYAVYFGMDIIYVSADGNYLLGSDIRELPSMRSLTEVARREMRKPLLSELAKMDSIDFPAKEPKHEITVFTDIDCSYCIKLHQGMAQMNELGITVHYVAFPRAGLNSPSYQKWVDVWCSDDRQQALTQAKAGKGLEHGECANPVAKHLEMAGRLGLSGTPAIITESGQLLPGYMPPRELLRALASGG